MRIIEGIKHKGAPFEIPDCSRNDLPEFFKEMGYKVGAEIGAYKCHFTKNFCEIGLKMYAIDSWKPYKDFDILNENRKKRQDFLYSHAQRTLSQYKDVVFVRKLSMDAIKDFEDESLDFIYIDANHKFKYVAEDICEWSKKVKKGGIISGHDYIHPSRMKDRWDNLQVKFVVDAYVKAFRIEDWYLLGRKNAPWGETRDRFRSWMWIKK